MKAVLLDADTLGSDIDLTPLRAAVDELRVFAGTPPDELETHLGDADLIITNKVMIPAAVMAGRRGIFALATGTDNIDTAAAQRLGVPVFNVTNYGTTSVAQHTWMLILALAARLPRYQKDLAAGAWQRSAGFCLMDHPTTDLQNKTLVIVGQGTLGNAVARLAAAFGMEVRFTARPGSSGDTRPALDTLLPVADVLSFHCPLTPQTRHLLNEDRFDRIKPGCLVINCARGGIIDEHAALAALVEGRLGGLAVDVLPEEPPRQGHPLLDGLHRDLNLIVTPHNAWISPTARQAIVNITADNIAALRAQTSS